MKALSSDQPCADVVCVVPTHDRPELLRRAVESILGQTVRPARIVVVDDMGDERVRDYVHAADGLIPVSYVYLDRSTATGGTAGASRNAGAQAVGSELVAFLDDDDAWEPTFLESATAELERSGADLVAVWGRLDRDGCSVSGMLRIPPTIDRRVLRSNNPGITGSNFVVRRAAFEGLAGFDGSLPVFNDLDFFVRFVDRGYRYSTVETELVTQFSHEGVHLSTRSARRAAGIRRYLAKHASRINRKERRRLRREICVAERYQDQPFSKRLFYFLLGWLSAEPADVVLAVRRRVRAEPRAYG